MAETTIVRWGNGQGIRISKRDMEEAGLEVGDKMSIEVHNGTIMLVPERKKRIVRVPDFAAMFSSYDGPQPVEDGAARHPMGAEE